MLVCNDAHQYIAAEQTLELGIKDAEVILEPFARNTAPAIAAATLRAMRDGEDPIMLIMPSAHVLEDGEVLRAAFAAAAALTGNARERELLLLRAQRSESALSSDGNGI
ncbi:hypothetical protein G6F68_016071 [Rhizopus microsporus]|nr:hypothetical protein G6F68_016071 [Rhizopus microsporus]